MVRWKIDNVLSISQTSYVCIYCETSGGLSFAPIPPIIMHYDCDELTAPAILSYTIAYSADNEITEAFDA